MYAFETYDSPHDYPRGSAKLLKFRVRECKLLEKTPSELRNMLPPMIECHDGLCGFRCINILFLSKKGQGCPMSYLLRERHEDLLLTRKRFIDTNLRYDKYNCHIIARELLHFVQDKTISLTTMNKFIVFAIKKLLDNQSLIHSTEPERLSRKTQSLARTFILTSATIPTQILYPIPIIQEQESDDEISSEDYESSISLEMDIPEISPTTRSIGCQTD